MRAANRFRLSSLLVFVSLLGACAGQAPPAPAPTQTAAPDLSTPYTAAAANSAHVYQLNPAASQVLVFVGKAGALSAFGHEHVIRVGGLRGFALIETNGVARADLWFPVDALGVDPPATREALGKPWSTSQPDLETRRGTRHNMLGAAVLDARRFPRIHLVVRADVADRSGSGATSAAIGITLHGVTYVFNTPIDLRFSDRTLTAQGHFKLKQSAFGITPYSAFLGALRVKDTLHIRYHLVLSRQCLAHSAPSCSTPP